MDTPSSTQTGLGKRKRSSDGADGDADSLLVSQTSDNDHFDAKFQKTDNANHADDANRENDPDDENNEDDEMEPDDLTYHEGKESFPACAAYDADFEDIKQRLIKISMEARVVLDGNDCTSEVVQNLRNRADAVSNIPKPQPSMIGLLGEAGAGRIFLR